MTLQDCYKLFNGNYEDVNGRLGERLTQKFVLKFLDDGSYNLLLDSLHRDDGKEAFRAAHTLKGVCQNLGLKELERSSSALTEALRGGDISKADGLLEPVKVDYEKTFAAIKAYKESIKAQ